MLVAALVGPYLVDWSSYRETFEARASAYIGQPVRVHGKADLRILPAPVLSFADVQIGDPGDPAMRIERLRAELDLFPLISGEIRVLHMLVERPHLTVDFASLTKPGSAEPLRPGIDPAKLSLGETEIVNGEMLIRDVGNGREWKADGINAMVHADTLLGPARIEAGLFVDGRPLIFSASIGRLEQARTAPLKLSITPAGYPVALTTDGLLSLPAGAPPSYSGTFSLAGIQASADEPNRPLLADLSVLGGFELGPEALKLAEMRISYGPAEHPFGLEGEATLAIGAAPRFDAALTARQIDLDRSLGGGEGPVGIQQAGEALIRAAADLPVPSIPGKLKLDAQGVVAGGSVIQAVGADFTAAPEGWTIDELAALFPGNTRLDLHGRLGPPGAPAFTGHARLASQRPGAFASWWRGKAGLAGTLRPVTMEADLDFALGRQSLRQFALTVGEDSAGGEVQVIGSTASVILKTDRVAVEDARAIVDLLIDETAPLRGLNQASFDLHAANVTAAETSARDVSFSGELSGDGGLRVDLLRVGDLAGTRLEGSGEIRDPRGEPSGRITGSLSADNLDGAVEFVSGILPADWRAAYLRRVAPALTPFRIEIDAQSGGPEGAIHLSLSGALADTQVKLQAQGRGSLKSPESLAGKVSAQVTGQDSATTLRQFGILASVPDAISGAFSAGPIDLDLGFEGSLSAASARLAGQIAGVRIALDGGTHTEESLPVLDGRLDLQSEDLDPALVMSGMALPNFAERSAARLSGTVHLEPAKAQMEVEAGEFRGEPLFGSITVDWAGQLGIDGNLRVKSASVPGLVGLFGGAKPELGPEGWSDVPFLPMLPGGVSLDLSLNAESLDLGFAQAVRNASLLLRASRAELGFDLRSGDIAGGQISGAASAKFGASEVSVTARGQLRGAKLRELTWDREGRPHASGKLDASFDLTAQGRSMSGVVATLGGTGSFNIADARILSINPQAFDLAIRDADAGLPLEPDEVSRVFGSHLDSGVLEVPAAAGSFTVASGVLRVPTVSVQSGAIKVLAGATFDLNARTLNSDWAINTSAPIGNGKEGQPEIGLVFEGPIGAPKRRLDVMPLIAFLNIRAYERELEEVERLQAEIAERQRRFEEARQRREEEERLRQEAEAKAAAERRRKADEAAARAAAERQPPPAPEPERAPLDLLPPGDDLLRRLAPAVNQELPAANPLGG